jgi:RNase P subunit RPR2
MELKAKKVWNYFAKAIAAAKPDTDTIRDQRIGIVGVTNFGFEASSRNLSSRERCPEVHAEVRLMKRMPKNTTIYIARAMKSGHIGLAMPCKTCRAFLRGKNVKVYYTIDDDNYGTMRIK